MDQAVAQSATKSYVSDGTADDAADLAKPSETSEAKVNGTLGGAAFLITMAAEFGFGFLVGLFVHLRTDEDYAAWKELKQLLEEIMTLETKVGELLARITSARKQCMAGIRRARNARKKHVPYHKALVGLVGLAFLYIPTVHAQAVQHEEGILIDVSASIANGSTAGNLFQDYLRATKKLLSTEPPNTRVWVSSIASDSFGGVREIVKGWTPDAHGIFTEDLNRARRQLATSFEAKSSGLTPSAQGTDIFGGLWHFKALFESLPSSGSQSQPPTRTLWLFSDMMNETPEFLMPELLEIGPERMLERAKAHGLLIPLPRYKIYIYGASVAGLTPRSWMTLKGFWDLSFAAAGAEVVWYSPECDVQR